MHGALQGVNHHQASMVQSSLSEEAFESHLIKNPPFQIDRTSIDLRNLTGYHHIVG